jgi:phosphoesterase RecJ-like protein
MDFQKIEELAKVLKEKDNYLLVSHLNYDADSLSSLSSLGYILQSLNKNFQIYFEEKIDEKYYFLPLINKFTKDIKENFNNVIILDFPTYNHPRLSLPSSAKNKFKINIDHHQTNKLEADLNFVFIDCLATAQIIYYLAKKLNIMDSTLATCLLLGIMSDTMLMTIEMTKEKIIEILEITKNLVENGADYNLIVETLTQIKFEDFKNSSNLFNKIEKDNSLVWLVINKQENRNVSGLINNLIKIKEAKIAVLFREEKDFIKIELRSKGNINVAMLAEKYFNGGGHKNASGGYLKMSLNEAVKFALEKVKEFLKESSTVQD